METAAMEDIIMEFQTMAEGLASRALASRTMGTPTMLKAAMEGRTMTADGLQLMAFQVMKDNYDKKYKMAPKIGEPQRIL